jgi:alkanesulfonate monooxygenase SsuD/methylene tetrahydromethanopterin reductase-like flavin-dependent oxidoreductase (luciferase family)
MKFFNFHLMPYADADLDAIERNGSAWVTFSNRHYDPRKGAALYHRYLDEMEYADALGFDGVCLNEHHQTAYGLMPTPGVLAGALARGVKRAKLAVLGRALPLVNNPLTIAEEFAILDNLTRGRFIAGFVRGIGAEYHAMGINPATSQERFTEAHDLILRAWTETGPFAFEGKHYHFEYVNLWPRPYQTPRPPIWIPSQGSSETIEWASHPDRRYTYLQTFTPVAMLARYMKMYKDMARQHGYEATEDQLGWSVPVYVAETDEIARREAKPHIENFLNKFLRMPKEMLLPPGYLSLKSMLGVMQAKSAIGGQQTIDTVMDKGMFICGSPETVRQKLSEYHGEIGFGHLLSLLQFGTLPAELTRKSMELYATEVIPYLRANATAKVAEAAE